ncbi:NOP58 [Mytilus edulis]|uniref:NOP58 n=1 Tax=Mytilus edulis TaxID=6550 RepID=A0A8S3QF64_MYTED|nr:NOP58 [Mytilus edulis]
MNNLITGLPEKEMSAMALGLAHSLSRYKLKFSPDKVDTMIVQAIWYRTNAATTDFSETLPEELEQELKQAAEISMGTEISEEDIINVTYLCEQVIEITDYRGQLYDYIKNRMLAVAPNLTILVGELVGARLIAHADGDVSSEKKKKKKKKKQENGDLDDTMDTTANTSQELDNKKNDTDNVQIFEKSRKLVSQEEERDTAQQEEHLLDSS